MTTNITKAIACQALLVCTPFLMACEPDKGAKPQNGGTDPAIGENFITYTPDTLTSTASFTLAWANGTSMEVAVPVVSGRLASDSVSLTAGVLRLDMERMKVTSSSVPDSLKAYWEKTLRGTGGTQKLAFNITNVAPAPLQLAYHDSARIDSATHILTSQLNRNDTLAAQHMTAIVAMSAAKVHLRTTFHFDATGLRWKRGNSRPRATISLDLYAYRNSKPKA